jgi:hypothetical protein
LTAQLFSAPADLQHLRHTFGRAQPKLFQHQRKVDTKVSGGGKAAAWRRIQQPVLNPDELFWSRGA